MIAKDPGDDSKRPNAGVADKDKLLEIQDHGMVAVPERTGNRRLERPGAFRIDPPAHVREQHAVTPFGAQFHRVPPFEDSARLYHARTIAT